MEHAALATDQPPASLDELRALGARARELILRSVHKAGAGHVGGPLSAADLLDLLYFSELRIDPNRPDWPDRDRFILSKGHSSIGLYSVMALRGYFPVEELDTFDQIDSRLQGHPDMTKPAGPRHVDRLAGPGALARGRHGARRPAAGKSFRTWVMLGDGEIQEGQIWEAAFTAPRATVSTTSTAILDYNRLPQFGWPKGATGKPFPHQPDRRPGGQVPRLRLADGRVRRPRPRRDPPTPSRRPRSPDAVDLPASSPTRSRARACRFMEGDFNWHAKAPDADRNWTTPSASSARTASTEPGANQ